jgi:hypothetical protein
VKLVQFADEGDNLIFVNSATVCFFRRCAPDRVEIHFAGKTSTTVRGTTEFVRATLESKQGIPVGSSQESAVHAASRFGREN